MKTKKTLAILLSIMLMLGTTGTSFADYDEEDDDKYERNEYKYEEDDDREYNDNKYEKEYKEKYEREDDDRYEKKYERDEMKPVEGNNGIGNGAESLDDLKKKEKERAELKERYKSSFKAKLGNRLDSIPQTKLETIIILIDTKVLELETDTTKTAEQKEKLVIIYSAIRDLISEKIAELNSGNILEDLLK